ncbi:hypothetical protein [Stieleria sedimenti]|uniref:hypothetical protein n=1 Tax=Stieleria sedimenti TaxID=2976331 RepID=UPI00217FED14|nr:hypothetical protein [Stieleria sedimenti]
MPPAAPKGASHHPAPYSPTAAKSPKPASDGTLTQRFEAAIAFLKRNKASRPRKLETLRNARSNSFKKKLPDQDIERVVNQLIAKKHVTVSGEQVNYNLPGK